MSWHRIDQVPDEGRVQTAIVDGRSIALTRCGGHIGALDNHCPRQGGPLGAQIRVRWTVLLVAGLALAAQVLGFEAILGAFLAGMLVRALDPDPEHTHPLYPVKLDAIGFGLLVPVFFVTSGLTLDLRGLVEHPVALATVPAFLLALLVVRGLPALAFRRELAGQELRALGLLQATSLPFLIAATTIGREMGLLDPAVAAGLVAAGLVSVLVFPAVAVVLLSRVVEPVAP